MSFSNIVSYVHAGFQGAFQFLIFPFSMLRRFSFSFMNILANRLSQRKITGTDNTKSTTVGSELPIVVDPSTSRKVKPTMTANENEATINIDLGEVTNPIISFSPLAATKRPSIEEIEKYLPVEKKAKFISGNVNWVPPESSTVPVTTTFQIENETQDQTTNTTTTTVEEFKTLDEDPLKDLLKQEKKNSVTDRGESTKNSEQNKSENLDIETPNLTGEQVSRGDKKKGKKSGSKIMDKPRLNYFIGIQVNHPDVRFKIRTLQEKMIDTPLTMPIYDRKRRVVNKNIFRETMIPVEKLHFTLHVMYLKNDKDIEKAKQTVENVWLKCKSEFEQTPLVLSIKGIGHFKNNVVFAKLNGDDCIKRVTTLADALRTEFEAADIFGETKPYKSHMTIAKVSRSERLYRMNVRSIPREMWTHSETEDFGNQDVEEMQLLAMEGDPSTGYYKVIARYPFDRSHSQSESTTVPDNQKR